MMPVLLLIARQEFLVFKDYVWLMPVLCLFFLLAILNRHAVRAIPPPREITGQVC